MELKKVVEMYGEFPCECGECDFCRSWNTVVTHIDFPKVIGNFCMRAWQVLGNELINPPGTELPPIKKDWDWDENCDFLKLK